MKLSSIFVLLAIAAPLLAGAAEPPNVIVILADDMGLDSVSAFNDQMGLPTPAIDQFAREGMSFTDAHSTSAVCSPTRYGVLTGRYTRRWSQYIRERVERERPFFLYAPMPSPHTPIAPHQEFRGKSKVSEYADFLIQTDHAIGEILRAVKESGQADNTLVFFTCDNGTSDKANFSELDAAGIHLNEHWRGWKADAYEGGHRVPFVVRWPGRIQAGSRCDQTITLADIMATCADVVGHQVSPDCAEDSMSLLPTLLGESGTQPLHDIVVHHSVSGHFAVRQGKWKLLLCRGSGGWSPPREAEAAKQDLPPVQLYDLQEDPRETNNLQAEHPDVVKQLTAALRQAVERGRSTPGPIQPNHADALWWSGLPWEEPQT